MKPQSQRDALIHQGRHWPVSTARLMMKHLPPVLDLDDLISAGNFGLCKAAETFDAERGVLFRTWAMHSIKGEMFDILRDWDLYPRTRRAKAKKLGETLPYVISLDMPVQNKSGERFGPTFGSCLPDSRPGPQEQAINAVQSQEIARMIHGLPEREADVVRRYFFQRQTFEEIAQALGISRPRAWQIHTQALKRLRSHVGLRALFE